MQARYAPAYSSDHTFLGAVRRGADGAPGQAARFAIAGVPFDGAVTNRPGARFGPGAIRAASRMLCDATHPLYDCSPRDALIDVGDLQLPATSLLAIVHLDAHCDAWSDHFGERSGHGTWMREAIQERLVIPEATVQIGIRSPAASETREFVQRAGGSVIDARELRGRDNPQQLADVIDGVRARAGRDRPPVYLTLDIDCLDPAFAPGTGTPEAGGLSTVQVLTLLEELAELNWVGMDCVEVAPAYDHADITSLAAATFVWTYLCGRIASAPSP